MNRIEARQLAQAVQAACIEAGIKGYEGAAISGLCHEGAWEAAVGAMRTLDIDTLLARLYPADSSH